jgi:hypothetical protein
LTLEKVEVETNPQYLLANVTIVKTNGVNKGSFNVSILNDIDASIFVNISLKQLIKNAYVPSYLNVELEICEFFKTNNANPIFKAIFNYVRQFGKLPSRCPFKKVREYGLLLLFFVLNFNVLIFFVLGSLLSS